MCKNPRIYKSLQALLMKCCYFLFCSGEPGLGEAPVCKHCISRRDCSLCRCILTLSGGTGISVSVALAAQHSTSCRTCPRSCRAGWQPAYAGPCSAVALSGGPERAWGPSGLDQKASALSAAYGSLSSVAPSPQLPCFYIFKNQCKSEK